MHVTQPVRRHTTDLGNCFVITYCTDDGAARLTMPTTDRRIIMEATGVDPFVITNQGAASLHLALHRLLQLPDDHVDKGPGATEREIDEARFGAPEEDRMPTIDPTRWGPRKQMNILIPSYLKNKFREKAEKNGHTMSDLIAAWMLNYVEEDNE